MPPDATTTPVPSLRSWRLARSLRQEELAEQASVHLTSVQRGEAGLPLRFATIRRLAAALHVQPADLLRAPPET